MVDAIYVSQINLIVFLTDIVFTSRELVTGKEHENWEDAEFLMSLYGAVAVSPLSLLYFNWRPGGRTVKKVSLGKLVQVRSIRLRIYQY